MASSWDEDVRRLFEMLDKDRNGRISLREFGQAMSEIGQTCTGYQLREMLASADLDRDGSLNLAELKQIFLDTMDKSAINPILWQLEKMKMAGGISGARSPTDSPEGTTFSTPDELRLAFTNWINTTLGDDMDCKHILPITDKELFEGCKNGIILCKMVNQSVPGTIDERTINKTDLSQSRCLENLTLAIASAQSIGCNTENTGPSDLADGNPHLMLGLLWQIIRLGFLSDINLEHHPGLIHLLEEGETLEDLQKLSPEEILLRWVNYQLRNAGQDRRINNFSEDIKDSVAHTALLQQIAPKDSGVDSSPMEQQDRTKRAECMLKQASKIGCRIFVEPGDVVNGNQRLNLVFVANLFHKFPALGGVEENIDTKEETREEKTYRNWMNSMGVSPYVNSIYCDLKDALVLFQLYDICKPGIVDWNKVNQKFKQLAAKMKRLENCSYACELGNQMGFSLDGVEGEHIYDGSQILALVWQLFRAHTISTLSGVSDSKNAEADILAWANARLDQAASFSGFGDSNLSDSIILIKLMEKLKPNGVDWKLVNQAAHSEEEKLANARYAFGIARQMGARIYAQPEDIVEVNQKMVMTIFAGLMARDTTAS